MNPKIAAGAIRYSESRGLVVPSVDWSAIRTNPVRGGRIARAYLSAPEFDPKAIPAYRAMREETLRQLDFLTGELGIDVEVTPDDPYKDAGEMMAEVREGRLRVYSTQAGGNPHLFFSDDDNDAFCAVHDASATPRPGGTSTATARKRLGASTRRCTHHSRARP
jgi:hypothetical protein